VNAFYRVLALILLAIPAFSQSRLLLKTRHFTPNRRASVTKVDSPVPFSAGHLILQFDQAPTQILIGELNARGVTVLQSIPENALLVTVNRPVSLEGLGVSYAAPLDPADKVSPLIAANTNQWDGYFLAEFHPDVDLNRARGLVLGLGIDLKENPDLGPRQLLIHVADAARVSAAIAILAAQDSVAYVFPASADLASGIPAHACAGPLTSVGTVGQYIATNGSGWDGPGLNAATILYVFSSVTNKVPAGSAQSEIVRAMAEWAKVAKLSWQPGTDPNGRRTVNILFAARDHGDGYPFDGPGGVLAHTFYPAPPNPEPIAGDMHLDADESWRIGANTDVFSVALHELGHALGLGHSDNPSDVMYPYYRMSTTLAAGDKAAILTMYAAQDGSTAAPPPPPSNPPPNPPPPPRSGDITAPALTITAPGGTSVSTSAASMVFSGIASDNVGVTKVTWSTNLGASGTASGTTQWTASIPLLVGSNTVTIRAWDAAGNVAWRSVLVRRY
jgi:hypothetical protein